jgi:uncharacterized protein
MEKEGRILLFAKSPVPGKVKTRLAPSLGDQGAADLHKSLVLYCLQMATESSAAPVELWCSPSAEDPFFKGCARQFPVRLRSQGEGDIGKRMGDAFEDALRHSPYALLMGTDCPSVTKDDLRAGAYALLQGADAVVSPAEDGGYVLIGLRSYAPELFTGIPWGTASVMGETRDRLQALRWQWRELPTRWDVDRTEDLKRLIVEGYGSLVPPKL